MKIILSLPEANNEFQALQAEDARTTAQRVGAELEILYADNNFILQAQQVMKAAHARPDALIVEPVGQGFERIVRKLAQQGIGVALLNCTVDYLEALRVQFRPLALFTVSSDQVEIGRIQGRQVMALLPSGGRVLYVQGPRASTAAQERQQGFEEVVGRRPGIEVVTLDALWTEESALAAVSKWIQLRTSEQVQVDVVAAQDDSMARGARRAVEAAPRFKDRWAHVPYLGIDGVPEVGRKLVETGQLSGTVIMPSNSGAAVELMARWLSQGTVPTSITLGVRSYPSESEIAHRARRTA